MRFASSLSTHPDALSAAREVIDHARQTLSPPVDFAALFVTAPHAADVGAVARLIADELGPRILVGCTAESVAGADKEVEESPGVSLTVARLPGVELTGFQIRRTDWPDLLADSAALGARTGLNGASRGVMLLGDPYTTPIEELILALDQTDSSVAVFGGMASAGGPGGNILLLNGDTVDDGLVGVTFSGALNISTVVSQGCRPIGRKLLVTRSNGQLIEALSGENALAAARTVLGELTEEDQILAASGLFMGIVMNEYQDEFRRGDFLVRNVLGAHPDSGAIVVAQAVRRGQTVQFHVRDAETADEDLRLLLEEERNSGITPAGALLFTCNGRGQRMFEAPHHDVRAIMRCNPELPVGGFFAAGEIGRVGQRTYLHGHTASIALFSPLVEPSPE